MAQVVITITDKGNGKVEFNMSPSFETMMNMIQSGTELTSAQAYAIAAANHVRAESKKQGPTRILIPRIGRP